MTPAATPYTSPRQASDSLVWVTAAASLLLVLVLFLTGQGTLLRLAIPAGATLVGVALYFRRPIGYLHFTLWTWFLTALVRRLVDWRVGFEDHNLVLLTPMLVTAIAGLTLILRERRLAGSLRLAPFFLCIAGILYGFAVGLIRWRLHDSDGASPGEIVYGLFEWLGPVLFGLHLYLRWPLYAEHKRAVQKSFLWGVLLLGAYGVYQFVAPPIWDTLWLEHVLSDIPSPGAESFGRPDAFQIRVWSTMNSPGVFAVILMASLLLLFSVRSRIKPLAAAAGYSAFLLTLVRATWIGWLVGLVFLARTSKGREIPRLLLSLVLLPVLVAPLLLNPKIAAVVSDRLQTFHSTGKDESILDRTDEYRVLLGVLARDPYGEGLSNAETFHGYIMDSGIIHVLYHCGWIGAALYLAGVVLCTGSMSSGRNSTDPSAAVYQAVLAAMAFELLSGNTFVGPFGTIVWTCIALSLSLREVERASSLLPEPPGTLAPENQNASALVA